MNCKEFELIVLALARNQRMDAGAYKLSMAHADGCERCAGRLASERFLIAGARAVAAETATEQAPARVEAALLAAFHSRALAVVSSPVMRMPVQTNTWSFWRVAAAAASILVLISTMAVFWSYSNLLNEGNEELTGLSAPVELPGLLAVAIAPGGDNASLLENSRPKGRIRQQVSRRKSNQAEVVTEFYPLIEGDDLDSSEVTQVVRVELPASALSAAGFSVGSDISTVPVKADVALGYDGLARAVRFVR